MGNLILAEHDTLSLYRLLVTLEAPADAQVYSFGISAGVVNYITFTVSTGAYPSADEVLYYAVCLAVKEEWLSNRLYNQRICSLAELVEELAGNAAVRTAKLQLLCV